MMLLPNYMNEAQQYANTYVERSTTHANTYVEGSSKTSNTYVEGSTMKCNLWQDMNILSLVSLSVLPSLWNVCGSTRSQTLHLESTLLTFELTCNENSKVEGGTKTGMRLVFCRVSECMCMLVCVSSIVTHSTILHRHFIGLKMY